MKNILISTDNTCNLAQDVLDERNIGITHLHYYLDEVECDLNKPFDAIAYYTAMDKGAVATTSLSNYEEHLELFTRQLAQGKDVVHITFSSGLSGTWQNAMLAAKDVNATHKNQVYVVDSLTGAGGLGLLVAMTDDYAQSGKSAKQVAEYAESIKMNICSYFTLDTVKHSFRGGRIAKIAGWIGHAMNIKPFLHCDDDGKLTILNKMFSRKKTLNAIINSALVKYNGMCKDIYVCQANCIEDAQFIADAVKEQLGVNVIISDLSPIIGSHGGTGALAMFFTGTDRGRAN